LNLSEAQGETIKKKMNILRDMFAGFASGKYSPEIPKCKAMIKFGEYLTEGNWDGRMQAIQAKTKKLLAEKTEALSMDALGFSD